MTTASLHKGLGSQLVPAQNLQLMLSCKLLHYFTWNSSKWGCKYLLGHHQQLVVRAIKVVYGYVHAMCGYYCVASFLGHAQLQHSLTCRLLSHFTIPASKSAYKQVARRRACNYVCKIPNWSELPPVLKIVTCMRSCV